MNCHTSSFSYKPGFIPVLLLICQLHSFAQEKKDEWPKYKFGGGPDSTYGKGGRATIDTAFFKDGSRKITRGYRDKNGKFRQNTEVSHNNEEGTETTTIEYFDSTGTKIKETMVTKDRTGNETYTREEFYKDGIIDSGDMYYDLEGVREKIHKRYDKDTQKWEEVEKTKGKNNKEDKRKKDELDVTSYLFLGGSMINEDNGSKRFNTYGGTVVYNRPVHHIIGVTGEIGIYVGTDKSDINYTKVEILGGVSFFPPITGKLFISPHVLAGVAHVKSTYGTTYNAVGYSFALAAGTDLGVQVSHKAIINFRVDYNPSFSSGGTRNNFWLSAGINLRMRKAKN